jgi:hypothetical protein
VTRREYLPAIELRAMRGGKCSYLLLYWYVEERHGMWTDFDIDRSEHPTS